MKNSTKKVSVKIIGLPAAIKIAVNGYKGIKQGATTLQLETAASLAGNNAGLAKAAKGTLIQSRNSMALALRESPAFVKAASAAGYAAGSIRVHSYNISDAAIAMIVKGKVDYKLLGGACGAATIGAKLQGRKGSAAGAGTKAKASRKPRAAKVSKAEKAAETSGDNVASLTARRLTDSLADLAVSADGMRDDKAMAAFVAHADSVQAEWLRFLKAAASRKVEITA